MMFLKITMAAFVQLLPLCVRAGEMAFAEVGSNEKIEIDGLDVPVTYARGINNLFVSDPMETHDWTDMSTMINSLDTIVAWSKRPAAAKELKVFEELLASDYKALPKNDNGLLDNNTARYALHRFFVKRHGWSVKGFEPGGGAWKNVIEMDETVKQASKYIVPTLFIERLLDTFGGRGLDLNMLAIHAATMEHVIRSETKLHIYKIFRTLELPPAGEKTLAQVKDILATYLMVYAFGISWEVSTLKDFRKAQEYLEENHRGWKELQELLQTALRDKKADVSFGFLDVVSLALNVDDHHGAWQARRCASAKAQLVALPNLTLGRVPLADYKSLVEKDQELFASADQAQVFGSLEGEGDGQQVIVPNYLNSKAMCLTTASFYMVCCPNECETLMGKLHTLGSPTASPDLIKKVLEGADAPEGKSLDELDNVAKPYGGAVPLHSLEFARWMHSAFPMRCPKPNDNLKAETVTRGPKTANEWMANANQLSDIRDMATEVGATLKNFEFNGLSVQKRVDGPSALPEGVAAMQTDDVELLDEADEVLRLRDDFSPESQIQSWQGLGVIMAIFRTAFMLFSMFGLIAAACSWSKGAAADGKPKKQQPIFGSFV